jgi:hypothetical protein
MKLSYITNKVKPVATTPAPQVEEIKKKMTNQ